MTIFNIYNYFACFFPCSSQKKNNTDFMSDSGLNDGLKIPITVDTAGCAT